MKISISRCFKMIVLMFFIAFTIPMAGNATVSHHLSAPLSDSAADVNTAARIAQRVYEIQNMDKTNLSAAEKKSLRNELKDMKAQADGLNRGVYLSLGAIIIILLILILILR